MASSGNFPLWSPMIKGATNLSEGDTRFTGATNSKSAATTFAPPTGTKFYVECLVVQATNYNIVFGLVGVDQAIDTYLESQGTVNGMIFHGYGSGDWRTQALVNGSRQGFSGNVGTTANRVLAMTVNRVDNEIKMYLDNTLIGNGTISISATQEYRIFCSFTGGTASGVHMNINCGHDSTGAGDFSAGGNADENGFGDFQYSPPTGFLAPSSANLPISADIDPAQTDDDFPQKQVNAVIYTGNASTRNITGVGFQPDLIITRGRSEASVGKVVDSTRGATKVLQTHSSSAESTDSNGVTAFGSDGYSLGSDAGYNNNSTTYVAYCWRANGGTEVSNSDGATTTSVQANTAAGFSIVDCPQYTPNSTFGHGLNSAPNFIIAKTYEQGAQWAVYHSGLDSGKILYLNSNAAQFTSSIFNSTAPTSSVFSMGASYAGTGAIIAYCWHDVEGFQKFGKYEGNANTDGAFVYTGFRPRILIIRAINVASDGWLIYDTARETYNPLDTVLQPHLSSAEYSNSAFTLDILSCGFKLRSSDNAVNGTSYDPYIYMAWGDVPFKYNNTF